MNDTKHPAPIFSVNALKHNMARYYPDLHAHVFFGYAASYEALDIFMNKISYDINRLSYNEIWAYIVAKEDMHDWWML